MVLTVYCGKKRLIYRTVARMGTGGVKYGELSARRSVRDIKIVLLS